MTQALLEYGNADLLQQRLGLSPSVGQKIAAIIIFAAGIECYLEVALWKLRGINPSGIKPDTDAKDISALVTMLEAFATSLTADDERTFIEKWCAATRSAFVIRNNIAHGAPMKLDETPIYMRNPRWDGVIRKREFGDFWADEHTLDLVREALAVLLCIILQVTSDNLSLKDIASPLALKALQSARSVLGEFASQDYNPTYEKY